MNLHYDKKQDALYMRFNESSYSESDEVQDGIIFDYNVNGKMIGIEIIDASKRFPRQFKSDFSKRKIIANITAG